MSYLLLNISTVTALSGLVCDSNGVFKCLSTDSTAALRLSHIIVSAVQNSLPAPLERAVEVVKECSSHPNGSLLLDFLAHSDSPNVCSCTEMCL